MTSQLPNNPPKNKPVLGGHETFAFRNGWLKKGIDAAVESSSFFNQDDALVTLGVGKNMVRSIRHWCLASGMLEESEDSGRSRSLQLTWLASNLLVDSGWDPYMEKEGSLWLTHWLIATNRIRGLVWAIAFSDYIEMEFSKPSLFNFVSRQFDRLGIKTTRDMIQRELDCFLHTYVATKTSNKQKKNFDGLSEDNLDCPLVELDLIRFIPEYDLYHFNIGPKYSLPVEIFGYALLKFISTKIDTRRTIALEECIYQPDSPGQVFKLDENSVTEYLAQLEEKLAGSLHLIETAGLTQIYLSEDIVMNIDTYARRLLQSYYE